MATEDPTLKVEGDGNTENVDILALSATIIVLDRNVSVGNTSLELWLERTWGNIEFVSESVDSATNLKESSSDCDEVTKLDIESSALLVWSTEEVLNNVSTGCVLSFCSMLLVKYAIHCPKEDVSSLTTPLISVADGDICRVSMTPEDEGIVAVMPESGCIGKELEADATNALDIVSFDVSIVDLIDGVGVNDPCVEVIRIPDVE